MRVVGVLTVAISHIMASSPLLALFYDVTSSRVLVWSHDITCVCVRWVVTTCDAAMTSSVSDVQEARGHAAPPAIGQRAHVVPHAGNGAANQDAGQG